jgi:hypothetical protein
VNADRNAEAPSAWRVVAWRLLAVAIPIAFAAGVIALGAHSPVWARIAAAGALCLGIGAGVRIGRIRDQTWANRWYVWVVVGGAGPLLAGAPDRVMVVVMAFLTGAVASLIVNAERNRRRDRSAV